MKRLSLVILALSMVVVLVICGMRFSNKEPPQRALAEPEVTEAAVTAALATAIPTPLATVAPTEDVQSSPRILSQLKDVSTIATRNLEFTVQAENAIAYSWIFTSPSSYAKGHDVTVFAEELTEVLPARGFTVSGTNSATLRLTHVPYSLNGWSVYVQCFGKNGATATSFPVTISVTQAPAVTNPPVITTPAPTPTPAWTPVQTAEPTVEPTAEPTSEPTAEPTAEPTIEPTTEPTVEPTVEPTAEPTAEPTVEPTAAPDVTVPPVETEAPVTTAAPTPTEAPSTPTEDPPSGGSGTESQSGTGGDG